MNNATFMIEVEDSHNRSKRVLIRKQPEYSDIEGDRLEQFHQLAALNKRPPTEELWAMAGKHITSIADMVKHPNSYKLKKWREKVTDLRNYTLLLDALLRDIGVE